MPLGCVDAEAGGGAAGPALSLAPPALAMRRATSCSVPEVTPVTSLWARAEAPSPALL